MLLHCEGNFVEKIVPSSLKDFMQWPVIKTLEMIRGSSILRIWNFNLFCESIQIHGKILRETQSFR